MNARGVQESTGDVLCFLNDDVFPSTSDWLERMLAQAARPEIGIVGALLLYPDGSIQHAGVVVDRWHPAHIGRFQRELLLAVAAPDPRSQRRHRSLHGHPPLHVERTRRVRSALSGQLQRYRSVPARRRPRLPCSDRDPGGPGPRRIPHAAGGGPTRKKPSGFTNVGARSPIARIPTSIRSSAPRMKPSLCRLPGPRFGSALRYCVLRCWCPQNWDASAGQA